MGQGQGGGRPKLEIDSDQVLKLAELHCTNEEIAYVLGCSPDTIERRFSGVVQQGYNSFKAKLRRLQLKSAEKGNPQMLVHLGKIYLDQNDKHLIEVKTDRSKQVAELKDKIKAMLLDEPE